MPRKTKYNWAQRLSYNMTHWVGTPSSLVAHTLFFVLCFGAMPFYGFERVMLLLTTIVSLEAIYLALLIQMTVNRHGKHIKDVKDDIEDIQEDIEELTEEETAG